MAPTRGEAPAIDAPTINAPAIHAPAKVNLNLRITGRRDDGYHLLASTVIFTEFGDRLFVQPAAADDSIAVTGPFAQLLDGEPDNICLRAVKGYRAAGGGVGPLAITVEKNIPVGAGLGGGSSDAAAMLRYLDHHATRRLDENELGRLATNLGADVPVCLANVASHMTGIGDRLQPVDPPPRGHIVLARPDAMLSTPAVFAAFAESGHGFTEQAPIPAGRTARQIVEDGNDLLAAAQGLCPEIGLLLDALRHCDGVEAAQMTGSGSACFALFANARQAAVATVQLTERGYWAVASGF